MEVVLVQISGGHGQRNLAKTTPVSPKSQHRNYYQLSTISRLGDEHAVERLVGSPFVDLGPKPPFAELHIAGTGRDIWEL